MQCNGLSISSVHYIFYLCETTTNKFAVRMDRKCCLFCDEARERCDAADAAAAAKTNSTVEQKHTPAPAAAVLTGTPSNTSSRCHRVGPVTRNPFFNYMRHKRETSCSFSIISAAKEAGNEWRKMTAEEKCPFMAQALKVRSRPRRSRRTNMTLSLSSQSLSMSRSHARSRYGRRGGSFLSSTKLQPKARPRRPRGSFLSSTAMPEPAPRRSRGRPRSPGSRSNRSSSSSARAAMMHEPTAPPRSPVRRQASVDTAELLYDW